jgi:DNA repair exonuclease SbcCD ATPase subunit
MSEITETIKQGRALINLNPSSRLNVDKAMFKAILDALEERTYQVMVHSDLGAEAHMEMLKYKEQSVELSNVINVILCKKCRNSGWLGSDTPCDCSIGEVEKEREQLKEESAKARGIVVRVTAENQELIKQAESLQVTLDTQIERMKRFAARIVELEQAYEVCLICGQKIDTPHVECEYGGTVILNAREQFFTADRYLRNLLAVIHGDGGHYQEKHGTRIAYEDAYKISVDRVQELDTLKEQMRKGTAELRRYVEGNGFTWCDEESTVFNVTTAIGWMGGAIDALRKENEELKNIPLREELHALKEEACQFCGHTYADCKATSDSLSKDILRDGINRE